MIWILEENELTLNEYATLQSRHMGSKTKANSTSLALNFGTYNCKQREPLSVEGSVGHTVK